MRDLNEVLTEMLAVIPKEASDLREELESIQEKVLYTAPEIMRQRWHSVAMTLGTMIGEPKEQWQHQVADIFTGASMPIIVDANEPTQ